MPPINLLIKPASGSCNMRCRYCFYMDETSKREEENYGMMSLETLETIIQKALAETEGALDIGFQGGEPTLRGLDFYRKLIEIEKKHNTRGIRISHAIQTNGYLIDDEWAEFFAENHFLVGLSMDGNKDIHDANRLDAAGKGTHSRVLRAAQILTRHKAEFNILVVVTRELARSIGKAYGYFSKQGFNFQQYIACLDPLYEQEGQQTYSLTPEMYGQFLCDLFDLWYQDLEKGKFVYIGYFINLINMLRGGRPQTCGMSGSCSRQHVIEADGSVYPCDFYVLDEYRIGNLNTDSFEKINQNRDALGFIPLSREIDEACKHCQWGPICRGGCRRNREPLVDGRLSHNYYCKSYQMFFNYAMPRLSALARSRS